MRLWAAVACLCLMGGAASAGFIVGTIDADLPDPGSPHGQAPAWAQPPSCFFDHVTEDAGRGMLTLTELFAGPGTLPVVVSGATDADPIMTIDKDVENATGFTWTGYVISLPETEANKFVGTPTSDSMTLTGQTDYVLTFSDPTGVPSGSTVSFSFEVLIPSTGPFSFTLTQQSVPPIPEPTSLALLALGGIALVTRRKRK